MQRFAVAVLGRLCSDVVSHNVIALGSRWEKSIQLMVSYCNGGLEAEKMSGCLECDDMRWLCAYACSKPAPRKGGGWDEWWMPVSRGGFEFARKKSMFSFIELWIHDSFKFWVGTEWHVFDAMQIDIALMSLIISYKPRKTTETLDWIPVHPQRKSYGLAAVQHKTSLSISATNIRSHSEKKWKMEEKRGRFWGSG